MASKDNSRAIQAGDLDRKLDVLTLDAMRNTLGEMGKSLSPFALGIYCKKTEKPGDEKTTDERKTAFGRVDFTIRYRNDIEPTMIVRCEGIDYDIKNVREGEGRRQWTVLECQKRD